MVRDQLLRVGSEPGTDSVQGKLRVGGTDAGEERVGFISYQRVRRQFAARHQRFGKCATGLERALIRIGPDVNVFCAAASLAIKKMFVGQPVVIVPTHPLDRLTAVWCQVSRRHTRIRPRLSRVFIQSRSLPGWRTDTVSADDDDVLQLWAEGDRRRSQD